MILAIPMVFLLMSISAGADGLLVMDGDVYALTKQEKEQCYETGSPQYNAQLATLDFAQRSGETTAKALCTAKPEFCERRRQMQFAIDQVFTYVRKLPSRFKSNGCADLRNNCQKRCETAGAYPKDECFVECNQHEPYNR